VVAEVKRELSTVETKTIHAAMHRYVKSDSPKDLQDLILLTEDLSCVQFGELAGSAKLSGFSPKETDLGGLSFELTSEALLKLNCTWEEIFSSLRSPA